MQLCPVESPGGAVEVWHEQKCLRGDLLSFEEGVCMFDPRAKHCTQAWTGSRAVCVCFTPYRLRDLATDDLAALALGFPLPPDVWVPSGLPASPDRTGGETASASAESTGECDASFGVYYSEAEFVREAVHLGHPRSLCGALPEHIAYAVDALATHSHVQVRDRRQRWLAKWTKRAAEIQADPDPKWDFTDSAMAGVLSRKRLQLLHEVSEAEGYADKELAKDIHRGFDLVGRSPLMPGKIIPATMQPEALQGCARRVQAAVKSSLGSTGVAATDEELWAKTMAEVKEGWLQGPYAWDDLADDEVPSHRFPLRQGAKLRPIDDYSLSGANACVTTVESPTVDTADVATAMASQLCWSLRGKGRCGKLVGRSYDLTSAYRQLCVSKASRLLQSLPCMIHARSALFGSDRFACLSEGEPP